MNYGIRPLLVIPILFLGIASISNSAELPDVKSSAIATLSSRSAKPGSHLELIVTVRSAFHPRVIIPSEIIGLTFKAIHKPQYLDIEGKDVWLFRYRVIPTQIGEYVIPPLRVIDGNISFQTESLFLHVSQNGENSPFTAQELALGVNIPDSLSQEIIKSVPKPIPKPSTSPTPIDHRTWSQKATSALGGTLRAIWNFPGK